MNAATQSDRTERRPQVTMMIAASLIVVLRLLGPLEIGKDQALQLEAAQRLVSGLGLTSTYFAVQPRSMSEPVTAQVLTWWPPTFSLLVAGLLTLGLQLATALKLIFAPITLVGWYGWSLVASVLVPPGNGIGVRRVGTRVPTGMPMGVLMALLPILLTPWWGGTDIFLWAGLPFILRWLIQSAAAQSPMSPLVLAGVLTGLLYSVRYASVFLIPAALLVLVYLARPNFTLGLRRFVLFAAAAGVVMLPTFAYVQLASGEGYVPADYVEIGAGAPGLSGAAAQILKGLPVTSTMWLGSPIVEKLAAKSDVWPLTLAIGLFSLAIILLAPLVLWRARQTLGHAMHDMAMSLSFAAISLTLFLIALTFLNTRFLLGEYRYYEPLSVGGVLVAGMLAVRPLDSRRVKWFARGTLFTFALYYGGYLPLVSVRRGDYVEAVRTTLSFTPARSNRDTTPSTAVSYPSHDVYSVKEGSRRLAAELHRQFPNAVFYADNYAFFVYDGFVGGGPTPGIQFRRMITPSAEWPANHSGEPLTVFWLLDDPKKVEFLPADNRRVMHHDPFEKTTVLSSSFSPQGLR